MYGQDNSSASISVLSWIFLAPAEANGQVGACTEHASIACNHSTLHSIVHIDECEDVLELFHHREREGIVVLRSVKCDEEDGCRLR